MERIKKDGHVVIVGQRYKYGKFKIRITLISNQFIRYEVIKDKGGTYHSGLDTRVFFKQLERGALKLLGGKSGT